MSLAKIDKIIAGLFFSGILLIPVAYVWNISHAYELPRLLFFYSFAGIFLFLLAEKLRLAGSIQVNKRGVLAWSVFLLVNILASIAAQSKLYAVFGGRYIESLVFYGATLLWLLAAMQIERAQWRKLFSLVPYISVLATVIALLQSFFQFATYDFSAAVLNRPDSLMGNPSFYAMYVAVAIIFTIYYLLHEQVRVKQYILSVILFLSSSVIVRSLRSNANVPVIA